LASQPPENEAFLREVDDELRRDQIEGFWKRYGRPLVGGVIALLAAWAVWIWWENRQSAASGLDGEKMADVVKALEANDTATAATHLPALKASKFDGYRVSAKLVEAALALQKNDAKAAVATYREVANDPSVAEPWRQLALVRQTAAEFDTLKPEAVIAQLKPLAVRGNPWFGSAGEMTAIAWIKAGKPDLAARIFSEMAKDEQVPETIRSRAVQMSGVLGSAAMPPMATAPAKEASK
jgi:hypothetical protein